MSEAKWTGVLSTTEPRNEIGILNVRQGNLNSETVEFQIIQNNKPYDLTGTKVNFCANFGLSAVQKSAVVKDAVKGIITFTFNDQSMQEVGRQMAYFQITKDEIMIDSTQDFEFRIESSILSRKMEAGSYIESFEKVLETLGDNAALGLAKKIDENNEEFNANLVNAKTDLQNQMNTVVAGAGNSESSSAEIIQGRNDLLGNSFNNLKGHFDNIENIVLNDSSNLIFSDWSLGAILSDGTINTVNTYIMLTGLKTINPNESIVFTPINGYKFSIAYYDSQGVFVKRSQSTKEPFKLYYDTPKYKLMIGLDDSTPITVSAKNNLLITQERLSNGSKKNKETKERMTADFLVGEYSLTFSDWEIGSLSGYDGSKISAKTFVRNSTFQKIGIGKKLKLIVQNGYSARVHWFNSLGEQQEATQYVTSENVFTAKYPLFKIIITYNQIDNATLDVINNLTIKLSEDENNSSNALNGKTLYSFGTSILAGHHTGISFPNYVAEENKMAYTKYAVNGAVVIGTGTSAILTQINNASGTIPDFIVMDSWPNNAYTNVTDSSAILGTITEGFEATLDLTTYCGSMEQICKTLQTKYFGAKILHVGVHKMVGRSLAVQDILAPLTKQICQKWSIDYLDLYNESNLNTFLPEYKNAYSYDEAGTTTGGSGTHLNELGNKKYYVPKVTAKLKTMV